MKCFKRFEGKILNKNLPELSWLYYMSEKSTEFNYDKLNSGDFIYICDIEFNENVGVFDYIENNLIRFHYQYDNEILFMEIDIKDIKVITILEV